MKSGSHGVMVQLKTKNVATGRKRDMRGVARENFGINRFRGGICSFVRRSGGGVCSEDDREGDCVCF